MQLNPISGMRASEPFLAPKVHIRYMTWEIDRRGDNHLATVRYILIASGVSLAFLLLGILVPAISLALTSNIPSMILLVGSALFLLGCLLGGVVWISSLIKTAAVGQWGWFVAIVIFTVFGTLVYGLREQRLTGGHPLL